MSTKILPIFLSVNSSSARPFRQINACHVRQGTMHDSLFSHVLQINRKAWAFGTLVSISHCYITFVPSTPFQIAGIAVRANAQAHSFQQCGPSSFAACIASRQNRIHPFIRIRSIQMFVPCSMSRMRALPKMASDKATTSTFNVW